jgi:hypothetical protein
MSTLKDIAFASTKVEGHKGNCDTCTMLRECTKKVKWCAEYIPYTIRKEDTVVHKTTWACLTCKHLPERAVFMIRHGHPYDAVGIVCKKFDSTVSMNRTLGIAEGRKNNNANPYQKEHYWKDEGSNSTLGFGDNKNAFVPCSNYTPVRKPKDNRWKHFIDFYNKFLSKEKVSGKWKLKGANNPLHMLLAALFLDWSPKNKVVPEWNNAFKDMVWKRINNPREYMPYECMTLLRKMFSYLPKEEVDFFLDTLLSRRDLGGVGRSLVYMLNTNHAHRDLISNYRASKVRPEIDDIIKVRIQESYDFGDDPEDTYDDIVVRRYDGSASVMLREVELDEIRCKNKQRLADARANKWWGEYLSARALIKIAAKALITEEEKEANEIHQRIRSGEKIRLN